MEEMCKTFRAENLPVKVNQKHFLYTEKKTTKNKQKIWSIFCVKERMSSCNCDRHSWGQILDMRDRGSAQE